VKAKTKGVTATISMMTTPISVGFMIRRRF
jgi:hypothetical protein